MSELSKRLRFMAENRWGSDKADLLAAAEQLEWRPMDSAPKGCVTEDAGCRGSSEWFLGLREDGDIRTIKRLPDIYSHTWCDRDETWYTNEWFVAWHPLPETEETNNERRNNIR